MDAAAWDKVIRERYPQPVAAGWHRVLVAREPAACLQELGAFHEVLLRLTAALLLSDAWTAPCGPALTRRLGDLKRPALGHWVGIIQGCADVLSARSEVFLPDALAWCLRATRKDPHGVERLNTLVALRNEVHHGAGFPPGDLERLAERAVTETRAVLCSMGWLAHVRVVRVLDDHRTREGLVRGSLLVLAGRETLPDPVTTSWSAPLSKETVYLASPDGRRFLDLHPWVASRFVPGANEERLHIVKDAKRPQALTLAQDETRHLITIALQHGGAALTLEQFIEQQSDKLGVLLAQADPALPALHPQQASAFGVPGAGPVDAGRVDEPPLATGAPLTAAVPAAHAPRPPLRRRAAGAVWAFGVAGLLGVVGLGAWLASPRCGDGRAELGEACDDGNTDPGDLCTPACTSNVATLPPGSFMMGYRNTELDSGMHLAIQSRRPPEHLRTFAGLASPATPVKMRGFRLMRTEVSRAAFARFIDDATDGAVTAVPRSPESLQWHRSLIEHVRQDARLSGESAWWRTGSGALPVEVEASWAAAYCAWAGGTVPTEAQFEYAARAAGDDRAFPWGDTPLTGAPEDCTRVTGFFIMSETPRANFNCGGRRPTPVGATAAGCTPQGICDLAGNVSEHVQPGPVRWRLEPDKTGGPDWYVAHLPGPIVLDDGTEDYHLGCEHLPADDPFGLRTGLVSDCAEHNDVKRPSDRNQQHPRAQSALVVRGGNFDDSLPVLFQTRARYPHLKQDIPKGIRCAFPDG